jgi:diguanylate cyclase (GGDEF)-like protein/putative nucleotidyltransferase with HDIG domain
MPKTSKDHAIFAATGAVAATAICWSLYDLTYLSGSQLAVFAGLLGLVALMRRVVAQRNEAVHWSRSSLADTCVFFAAMSLGAAPAILLAASDNLLSVNREADRQRILSSLSSYVVAVAIGALLYSGIIYGLQLVLPSSLVGAPTDNQNMPLGVLIFPLCLMVVAQICVEIGLMRLRGDVETDSAASENSNAGNSFRTALTRTMALTRWAGAAAALLGFATLQGASLVFLPLGAFIILLVHLLYRFNEQRVCEVERRERDKVRHIEEMATLHINTIESLAIAIDAKDQMTHGHVRRTQTYAMQLGKYLDISGAEMQALEAGALLHDVGKLAVPEYILNKPSKLTAAEFEKMKIHTTVGGDIIRRVGFPYPVEDIVRYHHEKWDGSGYPRGLRQNQIPVVARIIAVVDFYDATRCDRPYRKGMKREDSLSLIRSMAGTSFDPQVVDSFVEHIEELDALIAKQDIQEQVASDFGQMSYATPDAGLASDTLGDPDAEAGHHSIVAAQREVFALHEIAQTIGSSLNMNDTVMLISGKLGAIVPFDTCIIYLTDEQTGKANAVHVAGLHAESYQNRRITIGEGVSGWVIANARSMCNTPPELDLVGVAEEATRGVRALLSSPLIGEAGAIGAITLLAEHRGSYTSEHVRLLESVTQHAAVALNNALTFERTRESALSDTLTGMPNARALRFMLEQRLAESGRLNDESLAVLTVNISQLSKINELHGRAIGDRLLVEASQLIKDQFRQMDMVSRYAGDEFVAVMPMASHDVARLVAERIETAFAGHPFVVRHAQTLFISVQIGIACFPENGANTEELLAASNQNLLNAKRAGHANPYSRSSYVKTSIEYTL